MKNWYVTVMEKYTTVFQKQYLTIAEANAALKAKKEEYPDKRYIVTKDWF